MSSDLKWEPTDREKKHLPDALKFALRKRYGEPVDVTMSKVDTPYLEGLADCGITGAVELIAAIEKHDSIRVSEEW